MNNLLMREKVFTLTECFLSKECLSKMSREKYSRSNARNYTRKEIARTVGCDVRSAEKKMSLSKINLTHHLLRLRFCLLKL
jgi:hypothetical protein